ncbi:LOW QUALITY PROTEIN: hypothetical protein Cgig2_014073 [Carnegiea gigantea]|uniref:Uncharacterized protein n=1 Tax=Carnegiea gigantea TaxID=171969 RepID=A0A9Q1KUT4_9CARY|nr:LOW QUALITY PROTEIN: hypothetical protein Cgig2_014073 [Carnegiea gigantea]
MTGKSGVTLTYKRKFRRLVNEAERQRRNSNNQPEPEPQLEPEHEAYSKQEDEHETEQEDEHDVDTEPKPVPTRKRKSRRLIKEAERQTRISHNQPEHEPQLDLSMRHIRSKRMSLKPGDEQDADTEPEPMLARKRQKRQHQSPNVQPRMKRAPKRTPKKNIQFRNVNVEESVSEHSDLTLSGLLRHRMAPGGFLRLVERLQYEQWLAIVDAGFGGILSVRTKLIPKSLARWLLEKYDPWDNSLNLANGKLLIDEEDVYATHGLPMGEFELLYMDRVQFRGRKVERSFPIFINWDTDKVIKRDKDEQLSGGYRKANTREN